MACGVPVVASAVGVNREIVQDGTNGFLAATPAEWAEKLSRLIADRSLRHALGDAGRRTVEERYSLRATAPLLVSAVRDAITKCTSAAA
jgi:glycosyltransferase involved in cell wall biosynthesis